MAEFRFDFESSDQTLLFGDFTEDDLMALALISTEEALKNEQSQEASQRPCKTPTWPNTASTSAAVAKAKFLERQKYKCQYCRAGFTSWHSKDVHEEKGKCKTKPFQCDQCNRKFSTKCSMNAHKERCNITFECNKCGKVFCSQKDLKLHSKKQQRPCNEEYKCHKCEFKTKDCNVLARSKKLPCSVGMNVKIPYDILKH